MGGVRSFFIESKLFQLVVEEGGRYFSLRIFERGRYFMKSVFMSKNVAQWFMKSTEQTIVGVSPKYFYTFKEGDLTYTLQRSSNSFGLFLLLTELKVGGFRRSIIILVGKAKNGWKVFRLELRKILEPENYVNGGTGHLKFVAQLHTGRAGVQPFKSFVDTVRGNQVQVRGRKQPYQLSSHDKGKWLLGDNKGEKQNLLSETAVSLPGPATLGGTEVGSWSSTEDFNVGKLFPKRNFRRFSFNFKSNRTIHDYGKKLELRKSIWT